MKKFTKSAVLLILAVILAACSVDEDKQNNENSEQNQSPPVESNNHNDSSSGTEEQKDDEKEMEEVNLKSFFLSDGAKAQYEGYGNEFAELTIEVHHIGDKHIIIDEDNGGVTIRKIYRIGDDQITILAENPIDLNEPLPDETDLDELEEIGVYLKTPLEVGEEFEGWEVVETAGSVETPYQHFDNVLILEAIEDDFTSRHYLVPEYGEVFRETIMETEDAEDFTVTSSLKSLEQ